MTSVLENTAIEQMQFRRLRNATISILTTTVVFVVAFGGLFLFTRHPVAAIGTAVTTMYTTVLLFSLREVYRQQLEKAALINFGGILCLGIIFGIGYPAMTPAIALLPLLGLVLILPYTGRRLLRHLLVICGIAVTVSVLIGLVPVLVPPPPDWMTTLLLASSMISVPILILLLLGQFSSRLEETLWQISGANSLLEAKNQEAERTNHELMNQVKRQEELLALVSLLETPVVALDEGVLFAPLVGDLDSRRAQELSRRVLEAASEQRARLCILDITGVKTMDTAVTKALMGVTQALRLLGCQVMLSGISAHVALTLTHLGVEIQGVETVRSPQEALNRWERGATERKNDKRSNGQSRGVKHSVA